MNFSLQGAILLVEMAELFRFSHYSFYFLFWGSPYRYMICFHMMENGKSDSFFSDSVAFMSFSGLTLVAKTSHITLNRSGNI